MEISVYYENCTVMQYFSGKTGLLDNNKIK